MTEEVFLYCAGCGKEWIEKSEHNESDGIYCEDCASKGEIDELFCNFCGEHRPYDEEMAKGNELVHCLSCLRDINRIDNFISWLESKINRETHDAGYRYILRELVQNTDDLEPKANILVLRFTEDALEVANDGRHFTTYNKETKETGGDMQEIQHIWASQKEKEANSTGYHGTGFQTVFAFCNFPEIHSSGYSVTLDPTKPSNECYSFEYAKDSGFSSPYGTKKGVLFRFPWRDEEDYEYEDETLGIKPFKEHQFPVFSSEDIREIYENWKDFLEPILLTCNNLKKIRISLEIGDEKEIYQVERDFMMRTEDLPEHGQVVTIDKGQGSGDNDLYKIDGFEYDKDKSTRIEEGDRRRYYWCSHPLKDDESTDFITLKDNKEIVNIGKNPQDLSRKELEEKSISKRTDINIFFPMFEDDDPSSEETNDFVRSVIPTPKKGNNFFKISAHLFITQDRASIDTNGIKGAWFEEVLKNIKFKFKQWLRKFLDQLKSDESIPDDIKQKIILDNLPSNDILGWFGMNTLEYTHPGEGRKDRTEYWKEESKNLIEELADELKMIKPLDNWGMDDWLTPSDIHRPTEEGEELVMDIMGIPYVHERLKKHPRFDESVIEASKELEPVYFEEKWGQFMADNAVEEGILKIGIETEHDKKIDYDFISSLISYCLRKEHESLSHLKVIPNSEGILKSKKELKKAPDEHFLLRKIIPKEKRIHIEVKDEVRDFVNRVDIEELMKGVDKNKALFEETENIRKEFYKFLSKNETNFNPSKINVENYQIILDDEGNAREPGKVKYAPSRLLDGNKRVFREAGMDINWCSPDLIRKYKELMKNFGVQRPDYTRILNKDWNGKGEEMMKNQKIIFEGIISMDLDQDELARMEFVPCKGVMRSPNGRLLQSTKKLTTSFEEFDSFLEPIDGHVFKIFNKFERQKEAKEDLKEAGAMETTSINLLKRIARMKDEMDGFESIVIDGKTHNMISKIVYHACKNLSEKKSEDELVNSLKEIADEEFVPASYRGEIILSKPGPIGVKSNIERKYTSDRIYYITKENIKKSGLKDWMLENIKILSLENQEQEIDIVKWLNIPRLAKNGLASMFAHMFLEGRYDLCLFESEDLEQFLDEEIVEDSRLHELKRDLLEVLRIRTKTSIEKKENFSYDDWKETNSCFYDSEEEWFPANEFVLNLTPELETLNYRSLNDDFQKMDESLLQALGVKKKPEKDRVIEHLKKWQKQYEGYDDRKTRKKLGNTILYLLTNAFEMDIREEVRNLEFVPVDKTPEYPLKPPSETVLCLSWQKEDLKKILGHDFDSFFTDSDEIVDRDMVDRIENRTEKDNLLDIIESKSNQIGIRKEPNIGELLETVRRRQPLEDDPRSTSPPEKVFDKIEEKIKEGNINKIDFEGLKYYMDGNWYEPGRIILDGSTSIPEVFKDYYMIPDDHREYLNNIGCKKDYSIEDALGLIRDEGELSGTEQRLVWEGLKDLYDGEEGLDEHGFMNIYAPKEIPEESIAPNEVIINDSTILEYTGRVAGTYMMDEDDDDARLLHEFGADDISKISYERTKRMVSQMKNEGINNLEDEDMRQVAIYLYSRLVEWWDDKNRKVDQGDLHIPTKVENDWRWVKIKRAWIPDHSKRELFYHQNIPMIAINPNNIGYDKWLEFLDDHGAISLGENINEHTGSIDRDAKRDEVQEFRFREMAKHLPETLGDDGHTYDLKDCFRWLKEISVKRKTRINIDYELSHPILDEPIRKRDQKGFFYDNEAKILYISYTGPRTQYKELAKEIYEISKNVNPVVLDELDERTVLKDITHMLSTDILNWYDYDLDRLPDDQKLPPELFEVIEMDEESYLKIRSDLKEAYGFCQLCRTTTPSLDEGNIERMRSIISLRGGRYTGKPDSSNSIANYLWLCPTCYTLYDRGFVKIKPLEEEDEEILKELLGRKKRIEQDENWDNDGIKRLRNFCEWEIKRHKLSDEETERISDVIFFEREHYLKVLNNLIDFYEENMEKG